MMRSLIPELKHVLIVWSGGSRVHRIDVIVLIAIESNARNDATSPWNKLKGNILVPHRINREDSSVYKVRCYYTSNLLVFR